MYVALIAWRPSYQQLTGLLIWIGGVLATIIGSWIASKIRVYHDERKAHRDDLKNQVLTPLHDGLNQHFRPLAFNLKPVLFVAMGAPTQFHEKAKATEEPTEQGDVLLAAFPSAAVFGSLDPVLLEDAKEKHFRKEMGLVDAFVKRWGAYAGECHSWALKMAQEILAKSRLPSFPQKYRPGVGFQPYVMHFRLAAFVYKRLFRQQAPALRLEQTESYWTMQGEGCTAALGSQEQMEALVEQIDRLLESEESAAKSLMDKIGELQKSFQELMPKLEHAIAARRLHKRCDLVRFF